MFIDHFLCDAYIFASHHFTIYIIMSYHYIVSLSTMVMMFRYQTDGKMELSNFVMIVLINAGFRGKGM